MKTQTLNLQVVLYQDDGYWVAHCVELDVVGSHPERGQALDRVMRVIGSQIRYAMKNDPSFVGLFRPPRPDLIPKMAHANYEGTPIEVKIAVAEAPKVFVQTRAA